MCLVRVYYTTDSPSLQKSRVIEKSHIFNRSETCFWRQLSSFTSHRPLWFSYTKEDTCPSKKFFSSLEQSLPTEEIPVHIGLQRSNYYARVHLQKGHSQVVARRWLVNHLPWATCSEWGQTAFKTQLAYFVSIIPSCTPWVSFHKFKIRGQWRITTQGMQVWGVKFVPRKPSPTHGTSCFRSRSHTQDGPELLLFGSSITASTSSDGACPFALSLP